MQFFRVFFRVLRNKYFLALTAFAVWILFIDERDLISQQQRKTELKELTLSKKFYEGEIAKAKQELIDLQTSAAALEKVAREDFKMKKTNEDVFLIEYPKRTK